MIKRHASLSVGGIYILKPHIYEDDFQQLGLNKYWQHEELWYTYLCTNVSDQYV